MRELSYLRQETNLLVTNAPSINIKLVIPSQMKQSIGLHCQLIDWFFFDESIGLISLA